MNLVKLQQLNKQVEKTLKKQEKIFQKLDKMHNNQILEKYYLYKKKKKKIDNKTQKLQNKFSKNSNIIENLKKISILWEQTNLADIKSNIYCLEKIIEKRGIKPKENFKQGLTWKTHKKILYI